MSEKSVKVYALQGPSFKVKLQFIYPDSEKIHVEEAARISFVYNLTEPRRPQPSVEPEKTIYKNLRPWKNAIVPNFVVMVDDGQSVVGGSVIAWDGKKSLQGEAPWGRPVVGKVVDFLQSNEDVVYLVSPDVAAMNLAKEQVLERQQTKAVQITPPIVEETPVAVISEPILPEIDAAFVEEPIAVSGTAVEDNHADYTGDAFFINADGKYVGDDGFIVPRDFDEFYERYPKYVLNWVKKRLNRFVIDDDVEDWTQDLLIHMKFLPERSKHRQPGANGRGLGCSDVIETFNPYQQYGASERRFRNYINFCLANKFNTVQSKRQKNPVCRLGNIVFGATLTDENDSVNSDEYVHSQSSILTSRAERAEKQHDDKLFTNQFKRFVQKEDPTVFPAIEALEVTGPLGEAAQYLGVTEPEFSRYRTRLKQLAECFLQKTAVPKQRKAYKKRNITAG